MMPDMSTEARRARLAIANQGPRIASQPQLNELAIEMLATHDTFDTTATRWEPLVYWRSKPYQGEFVHIDDEGIRATWSPTSVRGGAPVRIFCFGGSTMWGSGVPDDATIPSFIAKAFSTSGVPVKVVNQGQLGYNSTQELIALIRECQNGNAPDIAIFYDGVNDINASGLNLRPGIPVRDFMLGSAFDAFQDPTLWGTATIYATRSPLSRIFIPQWWQGGASRMKEHFKHYPPQQFAKDIARTYIANVVMASAMGEAFGTKCVFFWQPCLFSKQSLTETERSLLVHPEGEKTFFGLVYDLVRQEKGKLTKEGFAAAGNNLFVIDQIFNNSPWPEKTAFFDLWHATDEANQHIAQQMVLPLRRIIASIGSERHP